MAVNISKLKTFNENRFMLHLVDAKLNQNHLAYWINILENSSLNFSCLVRDEKSFKTLTKLYPQHQILFASTPLDVETVVNAQPTLRAILFPLNAAKNIHLLRFNHLKHIFIGTKHSDQLSFLNKSYRAYDEIWLSGQSMIETYEKTFENLGHLQLKSIGKPQLKETFLATQENRPKNTAIIQVSNTKNSLVNQLSTLLLAAPTQHFSLFLEENKLINQLKDFLQSHSLQSDIYLNNTMFPLLIGKSQYIITDIDTLSVFHLAYNQPLFVFIPQEIEKEQLQLDIPHDALYFFSNKEEYMALLENIDKDPLKGKRDSYAQYFLGKQETLDDCIYKELDLLK